ncbi:single-stranded DNA-binding protein [Novosphingobium sp. NPDC080210]|uniref:single-stranded DNA-binding protein n=1 Tax=Novosphingobium sp. NPDC080210 TaxID=3390596 RepID=UPI003CFC3C15
MADLNQCQFIGRLGADPEIKSFSNGGRIANLRLACSESWKDKQTGERKERTEWIGVTLQSDGLVGVAERYLKKGSRVFVQGQFRTRKWQDQSGADRYSTEIVVGGFGGILTMLDGAQGGSGERREQSSQPAQQPANNAGSFRDDLDDDIPF